LIPKFVFGLKPGTYAIIPTDSGTVYLLHL